MTTMQETNTRLARAAAMRRAGYTRAEVAQTLGVSIRALDYAASRKDNKEPPATPEVRNQPWVEKALCAHENPDLWYPAASGPSADGARAKAICRACPVIAACLRYVMAMEGEQAFTGRFGIWAGLTSHERALLARRQRRVS